MIPNNFSPRKGNLEMFLVPVIVVLVGVAAFGLGRLSALESQQPELNIRYDQTL